MSLNIPPEGKGAISLQAYVFINGSYKRCLIVEACSVTQSAVVVVLGSLFMQSVPFRNIANVALVYDSGEVIRSFGDPRVSNPASLEYIQGYKDAFEEVE